MDINAAVIAIEQFLRAYEGVADAQVRPSGDDVDVIKIWVDLAATTEVIVWTAKCEAAIRAAVPGASPFRLKFQAEP